MAWQARGSADGRRIETFSGSVVAVHWQRAIPRGPTLAGKPAGIEGTCPTESGSTTGLGDGHLEVSIELPSYRSLERDRGARLVYQSNRAAPKPVISMVAGFSRFSTQACEQKFEIALAGGTLGATTIETPRPRQR